jgi:hypothetical protein
LVVNLRDERTRSRFKEYVDHELLLVMKRSRDERVGKATIWGQGIDTACPIDEGHIYHQPG